MQNVHTETIKQFVSANLKDLQEIQRFIALHCLKHVKLPEIVLQALIVTEIFVEQLVLEITSAPLPKFARETNVSVCVTVQIHAE